MKNEYDYKATKKWFSEFLKAWDMGDGIAQKPHVDTIFEALRLAERLHDTEGEGYDFFEQVCLQAGVCGGIGESVFSAITAQMMKEIDDE